MLTSEQIDYYYDRPAEYFEDILQTKPDPLQQEILQLIPEAIKQKKNISVKAGHGVGKTFIESGCIIWFLNTRYKAKVLCTAPTQHQLFDVLWSELSKHNDKSLLKNYFEWTSTRFALKGAGAEWCAIARSSNKPENMQGIHADNLLIIVDEASGVPAEIMEAIEGAATDDGNIIMLFGNPTRLTGTFHESFGIKSNFYLTRTMSCLNSQNVSKKYIEQIRDKYGEDSDIYRVRVLGEFPKSEENTLIDVDSIDEAMSRTEEFIKESLNKSNELEFGIDVARYGSDETTIYKRQGNVITLEWCSKENSTMEIVGQIVSRVRDKKEFIIINVDDTGVGGGVTDRLKELKNNKELGNNITINGINNQSKAKQKKLYKNTISELWFNFREFIKTAVLPNDPELKVQFISRRYEFNSDGRLMIESKEKLKDRGLHSPDRADGVLLSTYSLSRNNVLGCAREKNINQTNAQKENVKELKQQNINWGRG